MNLTHHHLGRLAFYFSEQCFYRNVTLIAPNSSLIEFTMVAGMIQNHLSQSVVELEYLLDALSSFEPRYDDNDFIVKPELVNSLTPDQFDTIKTTSELVYGVGFDHYDFVDVAIGIRNLFGQSGVSLEEMQNLESAQLLELHHPVLYSIFVAIVSLDVGDSSEREAIKQFFSDRIFVDHNH